MFLVYMNLNLLASKNAAFVPLLLDPWEPQGP